MSEWITDIQGYREILDTNGDPVPRRQTLQFEGRDPTDNGSTTIVPARGAPLFWSAASGPSNPTPVFLPALPYDAGTATQSSETPSSVFAPRAGTLRNLTVRILGGTCSVPATYTLRLNGTDSALTCALGTGATAATDSTHSVAVAAGDKLALKCVLGGTATGPTGHRASAEFF